MTKDLTLLVLAAGMGSRYGGDKQCDAVGPNGETILDYSVFDAKKAGFTKVVFVIREELTKSFTDIIIPRFKETIKVELAYQEKSDVPSKFSYMADNREKPWGTAHAIRAARQKIDEPFFVINADDFYGSDTFLQAANFLKKQASPKTHCMVAFRLKNTLSKYGTVARGVCSEDDKQNLTTVVETYEIKEKSGIISGADNLDSEVLLQENDLVSMNAWGFHQAIFDDLEDKFSSFLELLNEDLVSKTEYQIPTVVNELIQEGIVSVSVIPTASSWFGMTYKEDKDIVSDMIKNLLKNKEYLESLF